MTEPYPMPRCTFYTRTPVGDGSACRYKTIRVSGWSGEGDVCTPHPPAVGDFVSLSGSTYRVVERAWVFPVYGSAAWPSGPTPLEGSWLQIMLETAEGLFRDEAPSWERSGGETT